MSACCVLSLAYSERSPSHLNFSAACLQCPPMSFAWFCTVSISRRSVGAFRLYHIKPVLGDVDILQAGQEVVQVHVAQKV